MRRYTVDPSEPDKRLIQEAVEVIRQGGIVGYPTETAYGLAVDPRSDEAVDRLFTVKERDASWPVALIAADSAQAERAGAFGPVERRLAEAFWPGALTIVVPAAPELSGRLSGGIHTVGVRVPSHLVARALARLFGGCITATSANISGRPPAITAAEVEAAFTDRIDVVVDGGPSPGGPPSTIVEIVRSVPVLHRAGAVAWDRVLESLK
jgi:L-threonylcarbamoyladenylate synthase